MAGVDDQTTSSRAVLAALRALQEKIRRLETERDVAVAENKTLRSGVSEDRTLRDKYERVVAERDEFERRALAAESRIEEAEARCRAAESRRVEETQRATETEKRLRDAEASVSESLARSAELSARANAWGESSKLADLENVLEATVEMNKMLVSDVERNSGGNNRSDRVIDDAKAALHRAHQVLRERHQERPRRATNARRHKKHQQQQGESDTPSFQTKRRYHQDHYKAATVTSAAAALKPSTKESRRKKSSKAVANSAADIPWVPSSGNEAVSYNLLAACNHALRKKGVKVEKDSARDMD